MIIKSIAKIYQTEKKKPESKAAVMPGTVSSIIGDGVYAVKSITGGVVYGVRGPRNISKGGSISTTGSGAFSTISSVPYTQSTPAIIDIEV